MAKLKIRNFGPIKDGAIHKLKTYGAGLTSDDNFLNNLLKNTNKKFDELLDIQNVIAQL